MTPIVLNPYRNHGTIDMGNIDELIDTYALSLLIFYKNRKRQRSLCRDILPEGLSSAAMMVN